MADSPHPADRSIGQLISDATADLSALVKSELALARAELRSDATRAASGAGLFAVAAATGTGAALMLLFAAAYGLMALGFRAWLAFLMVAGALLFIAVCAALIGRARLKHTARGQRTVSVSRNAVAQLQAAGRKHQ